MHCPQNDEEKAIRNENSPEKLNHKAVKYLKPNQNYG